VSAERNEPLLSIRNLDVHLGETQVLRGIDLHVGPGEIVGVVGESGSGKSVTVSTVTGLQPEGMVVTAGEIGYRRDGQEIALQSLPPGGLDRLRGSEIGMVFQDPSSYLDPLMSVGAHLAEALWRERSSRSARRERMRQMLGRVSLPATDEFLARYPHQISGGQKQRVLIAAAIACTPRLLIADEPTTALDVSVQFEVLQLVRSLRDREGMSVLLVTHDLGVVAQSCDRVYVMREGRIVETNDVVSLFRAPAHPYTRELLDASFLGGDR
jgi:ABC-type dipeptide/oligopeptide/nickel transport system ATPase component